MKYIPPFNGNLSDPARLWINANPSIGIEGSIPGADAFQWPIDEIVSVIERVGMTPDDELQLADAVVPTSGSGWRRYPDGQIEQWGTVALNGTTTQVNVTLPIAFPSQFQGVITCDAGSGAYPTGAGPAPGSLTTIIIYVPHYILFRDPADIAAKNTNIGVNWRAWGK